MSFDPLEGKWVLVAQSPSCLTYECDLGDGTIAVKKEHLVTNEMLDLAAAERSASAGQRWNDGRVIGRMPLGLYYASGLGEAAQQGDKAFIRRFWNDSDHRNLRTFEGEI